MTRQLLLLQLLPPRTACLCPALASARCRLWQLESPLLLPPPALLPVSWPLAGLHLPLVPELEACLTPCPSPVALQTGQPTAVQEQATAFLGQAPAGLRQLLTPQGLVEALNRNLLS